MTSSFLAEVFQTTTCGELVNNAFSLKLAGHSPPSQPVCLDANLSVQEGCAALAAHKISSAPVYDANQGGFVGMLDYKDLVAYVLEVFHKVPRDSYTFDAEFQVTDVVKRALANKKDVSVSLVSNLSHRNPLVALNANQPLQDALVEFQKGNVHRVVVVEKRDGKNVFVGVLSQSTVAAFLSSKVGRLVVPKPALGLWPKGEKSVKELGLLDNRAPIVSITANDTVLDALYQMNQHSVSSVAIVEKGGGGDRLLGSLSMSDMKEIFGNRGGFKHLYENAFKFFAGLRSAQGLANHGDDMAPSFVIHPTTTVIAALEKMAATHGHRVWVVEGGDRLVGVLSLSDFVKVMN